MALLLAGCATLPEVDPARSVAPELSPAQQSFLMVLEETDPVFSRDTPPEFLLLTNLAGLDQEAIAVAESLLPDPRLFRRIEQIILVSTRNEPVRIWLSGRFPRFWTGLALRRQGWERQGGHLWSDSLGQSIALLSSELIRLDLPGFALPEPRSEATRSLEEVLYGASRPDGTVVYQAYPPLPRELAALAGTGLAPIDVLTQLDRSELAVTVRFFGEREARVALVTLRLASRTILERLDMEALPSFALVREGVLVQVEGVAVSAEQLLRLIASVSAAAEGEETGR